MSILGKIVETVAHVMPDRDPDELIQRHRYLGQPISRLDGRSKVTGAAHFSADYPVNGLVHAALAFSTISKGAIVTIDTSAAEQAPGVLSVITHLNAPEMKVSPEFSIGDDPSTGTTLVKILNTDRISWNGQPVAVVVADTPEQAEYAAALLHVTYAAERGTNSFEESIPRATRPKDLMGEATEVKKGNADQVFHDAAHRVDLTFTTPAAQPQRHRAACLHRHLGRR